MEEEKGKIIGRLVQNDAERAFQEEAIAKGWTVRKRGWPDFFCIKDGQMICVEVKPTRFCGLKIDQFDVMTKLADAGIKCYLWSPDAGFEKIHPYRPDCAENQ